MGENVRTRKLSASLLKKAGVPVTENEEIDKYAFLIGENLRLGRYSGIVYHKDGKGQYSNTLQTSIQLLQIHGYDIEPYLETIKDKSNFEIEMEAYFSKKDRLFWSTTDFDDDDIETTSLSEDEQTNLWRAQSNLYQDHQFMRCLFGNLYLHPEYRKIIAEYYPHWKEFSRELNDLSIICQAASFSNKFLSPQANGFQHGSRYQEENLARLQLELANPVERTFECMIEDGYTDSETTDEERVEALTHQIDKDFYRENPDLVEELKSRLNRELSQR